MADLSYLEPLCTAATHKQSQKPWDDAHGFWVSFALYFGWVYLPIFTRDRSNFDISADTTTRWFTMTKVCVIFATFEDVVRLDFGVFQAAANISQFDEILTDEKLTSLPFGYFWLSFRFNCVADTTDKKVSADTTTRWFTMTKVCVIFATFEDVVRLDFGVFQAAANIGQFDQILTQWKNYPACPLVKFDCLIKRCLWQILLDLWDKNWS